MKRSGMDDNITANLLNSNCLSPNVEFSEFRYSKSVKSIEFVRLNPYAPYSYTNRCRMSNEMHHILQNIFADARISNYQVSERIAYLQDRRCTKHRSIRPLLWFKQSYQC